MGGDIADIFTISNSVDIDKLRQMQQSQMKIAELRERSEDIARTTGRKPLGYFAFERTYPTPLQRAKHGALGGAAFGALIGAAVAAIVVAHDSRAGGLGRTLLAGSALGSVPGALIGTLVDESEETRVARSLKKYEGYITGLEIAGSVHVAGPAASKQLLKGYAATIEAERAQPGGITLG